MEVKLNEQRQWVSVPPRKEFEQVALEATIEVTLELVEALKAMPAEDEDTKRKKQHAINRAYSAIDHLKRIDL